MINNYWSFVLLRKCSWCDYFIKFIDDLVKLDIRIRFQLFVHTSLTQEYSKHCLIAFYSETSHSIPTCHQLHVKWCFTCNCQYLPVCLGDLVCVYRPVVMPEVAIARVWILLIETKAYEDRQCKVKGGLPPSLLRKERNDIFSFYKKSQKLNKKF